MCLSPLDDGGDRHHRFLLLHHLGSLQLAVYTRHFFSLLSWSTPKHAITFNRNSRGTLVASSRETWGKTTGLARSLVLSFFLPLNRANSLKFLLLVSIWFRSLHCSLVVSRSTAMGQLSIALRGGGTRENLKTKPSTANCPGSDKEY